MITKAEGVLKSMAAISAENQSFENKMTIKGCKVTIKASTAYLKVCEDELALLAKGIINTPNPSKNEVKVLKESKSEVSV